VAWRKHQPPSPHFPLYVPKDCTTTISIILTPTLILTDPWSRGVSLPHHTPLVPQFKGDTAGIIKRAVSIHGAPGLGWAMALPLSCQSRGISCPSIAWQLSHPTTHFDLEDGGSMFLQNIGNAANFYKMSIVVSTLINHHKTLKLVILNIKHNFD
jgi:hypothetical protein